MADKRQTFSQFSHELNNGDKRKYEIKYFGGKLERYWQ